MNKSELYRLAPYLLITVLGVAVYWTAGIASPGYFDWIDLGFPLNPYQYIHYLYVWDDLIGAGSPNGWLGELPYDLSIFVLHTTGLPLWVIDKMAFWFPVALRGYSMYYLTRVLVGGRGWRATTAGLLSAELFMYVPVDAYYNVRIGLFLAAIPLILSFFLKGVQSGYRNRYAAYVALASVLGFIFPLSIAFSAFIVFIYSAHHLFSFPKERKGYVVYVVKTSILSLLVSAYVILPALASYGSLIDILQVERTFYGANILYQIAPYFSLAYTSRLIHGAYGNIAYFSTPAVVIAGFAIALMAWASVLLSKNRFLPTLAITGLVATALSTGVEYPGIRTVYLAGYNSLLNVVFQTQYYFVYLLGFVFACMLGLTAYAILNLSRRNPRLAHVSQALFLIAISTSAGLYAYPLFYDQWTDNTNTPHPPNTPGIASGWGFHGTNFQIPSSYDDLRAFLEHDATANDRLLVAPVMNNFYQFAWSGKNSLVSIIPFYSPIPVFGRAYTFPQIVTDAEESLSSGGIASAIPFLQALSVRYVLVPNDIPSLQDETRRINYSISHSPFFTPTNFGSFTLFTLKKPFLASPVFALPYESNQNKSNLFPEPFQGMLPGVVGNWPLNDSSGSVIADVTGNGNNGLLVNSPTWEEGANCKFEHCLSFASARNQYATIPNSVSLPSGPFSVSLWVYHEGTTCPTNQAVISKGSYNSPSGWAIVLNANSPCDFLATVASTFLPTVSCSATTCPISGWNNLVLTFDGYHAKFYLNGAMVASSLTTLSPDTSDIWLAREPVAFSYADIRLEDVLLYSYAISASQVTQLYTYSPHALKSVYSTTSSTLNLNYSRIDPTDYAVQLYANKPFTLVFDEAFSGGWVATVNGRPAASSHFLANGYANGWVFNETGKLEITLRFTPQEVVFPAFLISSLAVLGILFSLAGTRLGLKWPSRINHRANTRVEFFETKR